MSASPVTERLVCTPLGVDQARLLVTGSPAPIMVLDIVDETFNVLASHSLLRRLVTGARHPAGPMFGELIDANGFGVLETPLRRVVAEPFETQTVEIPVGDEPHWFEVALTPVGLEGEPTQVLVVAADRTAEYDVEQRNRRSARRFDAMVSNAPGLILLVDSAGRIIRCTPAVDRLLGVAADELVGRAIFELLHPETLARSASVFNQVLSQPGVPIAVSDFGMSHTTGSTVWCEAIATNLLHDLDVAAVVVNAHDVTDRRMAEERLELAATSDALTGLANRRRLEQRLDEMFEEAARIDSRVGLVLIDIDDFKLVNDGLGHNVGDAVLLALASRLEGLVGDHGLVARIGGDEFALVMEPGTPTDLASLAQSIHDLLRSPVSAGPHEVYVRASIGTSTGHYSGADAGSLLRSADLALYRAKQNGRNQTVRFTAELQLDAEQRLEKVTELQRALREGRLRLAYQPIMDAAGCLVGAEALLRWDHDGELLTPARFLELAEDTGLILPIGAWVLDQVCADYSAASEALGSLGWISVNLSSHQLVDERLSIVVRDALDRHGLSAEAIAVEVDESALLDDVEKAAIVLRSLGGVGVFLAVGDLAKDQEALRLSQRLELTGIKLDRKFVQQLDVDDDRGHAAIAAAVLEHCEAEGLTVVATGVENPAQERILRDLGCRLFQGFLFAEPMDLGSFLTWMRPGGQPTSPQNRAPDPGHHN